jgi:hypothetical protein
VIRNDPDLGVRVTVLALVIRNDPDREARAVASVPVIRSDPDREARVVASVPVIRNDPKRLSSAMRLALGRSEVAVRQTVSGAACGEEMRHQ